MINKITELLGTSNTMTTAVTLAAGGYILNLLKAIPLSILRMIIKKVTKSVYVTSDNYEVFIMMENQIYKNYENLFKNHISGDMNQIYGLDLKSFSIAPGIYTKIDWKNLSIINVSKFELNVNNFGYNGNGKGPGPKAQLFKLGISAYGLYADRILDEYKALIKRANDGLVFDNDKFIKILEYSNPYEPNPVKYVGKKKRENIFDERVLDVVDNHLEKFINNEELYNNIGDIFKTGILLHGKPGTGKSCIAKYIAGKLDAMVYVWTNERMELAPLPNLRAISKSKYIVVLMEEIDKMIKERGMTYYQVPGAEPQRIEPQISQESLSTLLQTMDGIKSMDGVIFIATTNHIEHLPDSLIRKGRFDLVLEMNGITEKDAINMCTSFGVEPALALPEPSEDGLYNPAELRNNLLVESYNPGCTVINNYKPRVIETEDEQGSQILSRFIFDDNTDIDVTPELAEQIKTVLKNKHDIDVIGVTSDIDGILHIVSNKYFYISEIRSVIDVVKPVKSTTLKVYSTISQDRTTKKRSSYAMKKGDEWVSVHSLK